MASYYDEDDDDIRYGLRYQDDLDENEKDVAVGDSKSASKRGAPHTRGTSMSFGFRRRPAPTGIPVPIASNKYQEHARSKSVGPEHESRRRQQVDEDYHQPSSRYQNYSSSGRSTPRLAPPKKESSGLPIRTSRFGFRSQQPRYTDKVTDLHYNSHGTGHEPTEYFRNVHQETTARGRPARSPQNQPRPSPVNQPSYNNNINNNNGLGMDNRRNETVGKYTTQSSHLPLPQYAVRMAETSSKSAKTMANQNRKVGGPTRSATCSSKEGSGTEDSGIGSHGGYSDENVWSRYDRQRPRKLGVVLNGKSFDVRDVDDVHTITEISVIPLPKNLAPQQLQRATPSLNLNNGLVRERTNQYQRALLPSKDNRYSNSTTSMSTTSSEGYDDGLGEEKAYKDRTRSEKLPASTSSSIVRSTDFSTPSSDEQEFGHGGEAMADEYSLCSSEDFGSHQRPDTLPSLPANTVTQTNVQHFRAISNAVKTGALPSSMLRSVLLTIEDPAFAAVAATTTTLIDDETSPVDSLFDSPTASVSQTDVKPKKEVNVMEKSGNTIDDDSPGTPTNASNSLSLSEGREFFDDEIADQPGLMFDETLRGESSAANTDHSQTVLETAPKKNTTQMRSVENSPMHMRKRAGSISTLSSCESLASDDLMMDYERSDASSFGGVNSRGNSMFIMQDLDDATSILELEIQAQESMRDWNSLLGQTHQSLTNSTNNNINNNQNTESGLSNNRTSRLLSSRSSTDSPRSLDGSRKSQLFSPLRPPRNVQSPSVDSGDESSLKLERGNYNHMLQDIVSIKTMLLQLKRVVQESDSLNPFDNLMKNGLSYTLNDSNATHELSSQPIDPSVADELVDLRRQVVFLQGQVDEKDRTIASLQAQLSRLSTANGAPPSHSSSSSGNTRDTANAATQTDKLRPVSTGASILQGHPQDSGMGSLVSWNDGCNKQQQQQQRARGLRPPSGRGEVSPTSPVSGSAIPRRQPAPPTLIPRAPRAVSATGRAQNS